MPNAAKQAQSPPLPSGLSGGRLRRAEASENAPRVPEARRPPALPGRPGLRRRSRIPRQRIRPARSNLRDALAKKSETRRAAARRRRAAVGS